MKKMTEFTPKEMSVLEIMEEIAHRKKLNEERVKKREQYRNMMSYYEGLMKNEDCEISDTQRSINTFLDLLALQMGKNTEKKL